MAQNQRQNNITRYRGMIISIVFFLALIILILALNLYSATKINQDTAAISAATKLRDSIQTINKNLFDLKLSWGEDVYTPHMKGARTTLEEGRQYISEALNTFLDGGEVSLGTGENLYISPISTPNGRNIIAGITPEWESFEPTIKSYLATATDFDSTADPLDLAVNTAQGSGVFINNQINILANEIKTQANERARNLKIVQFIGLAAVILYFIIFLFFFVRRLRNADKLADAAKRETDSIMATVNEGLFLIDEDLTISNQYSAQLESIVGQDDVAGKTLGEMLEPLVQSEDVETVREFIEQLFNPKVKEKLIKDLNPLSRLDVQEIDANGEIDNRHLAFNFSRVYEGKNITNVLTSVADITRSVKLEQQLELEREQNDNQLSMLSDILNADDQIMASFIRHSKEATTNINEILKRPDSGQRDLQQKANEIFRHIHGLKGEASALKLENFVNTTHEFEEKVSQLQNKRNLKGNDFLALTVELEALIEDTNKAEKLLGRLSGGGLSATDILPSSSQQPTAQQSSASLDQHFEQYTQEVAARNGKQVAFRASGLDTLPMGTATGDKIKDTITQLIRNAIAHGIEDPSARSAAQKSPTGIVRVQVTQPQAGILRLTVDDDGNGIDVERIRAKAVAMGLYNQNQADALTKQQLQQLIFNSGLSTASAVGEDAGRGVGMDVIKERVKQLSGQIGILSEQGKYTRFVIQFPI